MIENEHKPVAWMMEMQPPKNTERAVKMTSYELVAKEWEAPIPLYTAPPKREWVGLTDEEIAEVVQPAGFGRKEDYLTFGDSYVAFMSAINHLVKNIESKLKEKNT